MKRLKKILQYSAIALLLYLIYNAVDILRYSSNYSEKQSDVAIVLGAGTQDGVLSPIFRERINHSIELYKNERVNAIIFTGGFGKNQAIADSEVAKKFAIEAGIRASDIFIEVNSHFTSENLEEAKKIMDALHYSTALLVSDPFHMKRAMEIATSLQIDCESSPTPSTMYRTFQPKFTSLIYETFYYSLGKLSFQY